MVYRHYKNNKNYYVVDYCSIQENGVWITGLIYKEVNGGMLFVRSEKEFEEKFELVK